MHCPALQRGAASPSEQGLKSRLRRFAGRAIGWRRGLEETQQSRSVAHGTGSNHVYVQPRAGSMQSQLGPTSTGRAPRRSSGTPPSSAMQRPPARSTAQARGWQPPVGAGIVAGFKVQAPARHRQAPGGGTVSSQPADGAGAPQRRGTQGSSHPQSVSALHATTASGSGGVTGSTGGGGAGGGGETSACGGAGSCGGGLSSTLAHAVSASASQHACSNHRRRGEVDICATISPSRRRSTTAMRGDDRSRRR